MVRHRPPFLTDAQWKAFRRYQPIQLRGYEVRIQQAFDAHTTHWVFFRRSRRHKWRWINGTPPWQYVVWAIYHRDPMILAAHRHCVEMIPGALTRWDRTVKARNTNRRRIELPRRGAR